MLKKTMVLAAMAVAATAFALPAVSSASWSKDTEAATAKESVTFSGNAAFVGGIGGVECTSTHSLTTLEPGTTGTVNTFEAVASSCSGKGGLAFCKVVSVTSTNRPWTAHTDGTDITITNVDIDNTFSGAFCPYHELTLEGNVTVDVDNLHHATKGALTGSLTVTNGTNLGEDVATVTASGTQNVTPSGTYGIT